MEKWPKGHDAKSEKFFDFVDKIMQRVNDIGAEKNSTIRAAQAATEKVYEATSGDVAKVTDKMIASTFDEVDAE
jgi:hypothetical protein